MATNLNEFYTQKGQVLPSVQDRTPEAIKAGITNYSGTAEQNTSLLNYLQGNKTNTVPNISDVATSNTLNIPTDKSNNPYAGLGTNGYVNSTNTTNTANMTSGDAYIKSLQGLDNVDTNAIKTNLETQYGLTAKADEARKLKAQIEQNTAEATAQQLGQQGRLTTVGTISGAQKEIERNLAIKNLPLTAQYQAAQGDYQAAQDTITKLYTAQVADAENKYNRKLDLIKAAYEVGSSKEKTALEAKAKEEERKYQTEKDLLDFKQQKEMAKYQADLAASKVGSTNGQTDNERALMSQFRGEQIVKDYNEVLGQKGAIDAYIQNGVGGPADLALVFSFMKGLDPNSVVRESEFDAAAKSGNIFQGVYAKFNGYFKDKGGILPPNVRQEFQNLVNQKLAVKTQQYNNVKSQYEGIAKRQGLNTQNVVIDYAGGAMTQDGTQNQNVTYSPSDEALFDSILGGTKTTSTTPTAQNTTPTKTGYSSFGGLNYTAPKFNLGSFFK